MSVSLAAVLASAACVPGARRLPRELPEVSGLVARPGGGYTALNDGGNAARLYALDRDLRLERALDVEAANVDWEALSVTDAGYAVCDVGDNRRARVEISVVLVDSSGRLAERLPFRYPDGAHDAEACYVRDGHVTVLTKPAVGWFGGDARRVAYAYRGSLKRGRSPELQLVDSLALPARSVTDACLLGERLVVLAYEFDRRLGLPISRTSLFTVGLDAAGRFRDGELLARRIRAPFTPTQYEAVGCRPGEGSVVVASERTLFVPQRWRRVRLP